MDQLGRKQLVSPEVAMASEVFDQFCNASTLKSILGHFRHLCELLKIKPNNFSQFYPKLKSKLKSWKAQALWKKFDQRANHKCYNRGKACPNTRVLIIGGGPCGLRSAIEAQLLGAKVVVVEKRDRMSRNNVLHLWPFVIQDLRSLGAKKFFGKFCAGSIDHISIRQLQCILLKVALILGVEFHENVSFETLVPPPENQEGGKIGWRVRTSPADHPVSQYEFDVLIGADGKRNTLDGFKRKEFRGKLAIAITANFINKRTEAEARVEEISGVAFIFNQKFFKELYQETGIDLENIVYYKDDTHYFVMTAKKHSLIDKGVILQDHADTAKLLAKENVDRDALMLYAREAADFSTEYQMMDMEFAVNHYGQPDVAMFDFTSMYAAENASRVLERHGHRLLMILVGDSLLEPFWPTGSGCARGFLSSLDACWAIKGWGASLTPLEVIAERESIYRLLGQTTPENLNRDYAAYTLDPHTRYPNLNSRSVTSVQVLSLLDTDDPESIKQTSLQATNDVPKKRRKRDAQVHPDTLLHWLQRQVALYDTVQITDMAMSFKSGLALSAIIHLYRPDLIDFHTLKVTDHVVNNQLAFDILEKEIGIPPIMTGEEMVECEVPDKFEMFAYLTQIYEAFRGEIPHIKHAKLESETDDRPSYSRQMSHLTHDQKSHHVGRIVKQETVTRTRRSRHGNENIAVSMEKKINDASARRSRKRRSTEKMGATVEERTKRLEEIEKNRVDRMKKRQYLRKMATQQFYKSMQMLQANAKREKDEPFEDYSIFLYRQTAPDFKDRVKDLEQKILYPDREPKLHAGHRRKSIDEEFSGKIKSFEDILKKNTQAEKKPKDLLRAIGKIGKDDWNVKEIEKKIEENRMGRHDVRHDRVERVPKWSREQFLARQIKIEKRGREPTEKDSKYADIDSTIKNIDKKLKESNLVGPNKVSAMAEQFANKSQDAEPKVQRSNSKVAVALPAQGGSEMCHFCDKRVYLMERLNTEGKSFHRGCFRCEYCSTSLRIGNHTFDRDKDRFYCSQHYGLLGTMKTRIEKKKVPLMNKENIPHASVNLKVPEKAKTSLEGVAGLDLLDRGQTPERIEFENLAGISDAEEARSQMDEDEWTDRNFGPSAAEMGSSDEISDMSDSDDDNEIFEEAIDQAATTEGTLELAKNWTLRYSHPATAHSDTGSNEYEDSSDEYTSEEDDSATATEDEDDKQARDLRKKEVRLQEPLRSSDTETGSETEIASDDEDSGESEQNSATEISTDSEFEHDGTTPTQHEVPKIMIDDAYVRKTRGNYVEPKKVQVKSSMISSINGNVVKEDNPNTHVKNTINQTSHRRELNSNTIIPNSTGVLGSSLAKENYLINRAHPTEGIASKVSLELKKKYLFGSSGLEGSVAQRRSAAIIGTDLQNLSDAISQHQKLLTPAPKPSPTVQAFLQGTSQLNSGSNQVSPMSPTLMFTSPVKAFPFDRNSKTSEEANDRPEGLKRDQLPDLVKESSIPKTPTEAKIVEAEPLLIEAAAKEPDITVRKIEGVLDSENPLNLKSLSIGNPEDSDVFRPRSPLHEASIVVPQVNWEKQPKSKERDTSEESEIDSDSLSSTDLELDGVKRRQPVTHPLPRLQIHSTDGDLLLDEQVVKNEEIEETCTFEPDSIECSYLNEKLRAANVQLNDYSTPSQNKEVEIVNHNLKHLELRDSYKKSFSNCSSPTSVASVPSQKQDDSEENDITTAALTETEVSEWARDGNALSSEDLRDVEFDINPEFTNRTKLHKHSGAPLITIANGEDLTDLELDSQKSDRKNTFPSNDTSKLLANGEDIDYMDTDNESLLDDSLREVGTTSLPKNRGYVEFVNFKTPSTLTRIPNSMRIGAPIAKTEIEMDSCSDGEYRVDDNVIEINPVTIEDVRDRLNGRIVPTTIHVTEYQEPSWKLSIPIKDSNEPNPMVQSYNKDLSHSMEEDSLLIVEPTEDTTTSEIVTVLASPVSPNPSITPTAEEPPKEILQDDANNPDYLEYVKQIQSRIAEFSNAKDSIEIRKSKRRNSRSSIHNRTADLISEEIKSQESSLNNGSNSPATSRKIEEIMRERSKQKNVIQDLLMDELEAHKQKLAEKRARRAARNSSFTASPTFNPSRTSLPPSPLTFIPTSITTPTNSPIHMTFAEAKAYPSGMNRTERFGSVIAKREEQNGIQEDSLKEFKTPIAPPRHKHEEARRTAEKARQEARERARLKSDEDLGLSPEDKIRELRMKVPRRQLSMEDKKKAEVDEEAKNRRYSFNFMSGSKLQASKSTDNVKAMTKKTIEVEAMPSTGAKSMDELLDSKEVHKREKKKSKDPERRRSIIRAVSDFFKKKDSSPSPPGAKEKTCMFRLTPKSKDKSKIDKISPKYDTRPKSVCEGMLSVASFFSDTSSTPTSATPLNYINSSNVSEDSLSDEDSKTAALSTSQMNKSTLADSSCTSAPRKAKTAKRLARQVQLKRLRMAQEIQRKLEETEVKQKELEGRGVSVEKALWGEGESLDREEDELLREWFDLMRERTELRRYEKELLVRAQEVQLEDRHDRLEQELRERLADDNEKKTSSDVKKEGEILSEMLEIVAKRDSLIALLEEERQRYQNEDRDIEAQMLAKGLRLTPIKKGDSKYSV